MNNLEKRAALSGFVVGVFAVLLAIVVWNVAH